MLIYLHPKNPEIRSLKDISEKLKEGAVYIFPTDTVYAMIADPISKTGVEKLYYLKEIPKNKPLSLLCYDISQVSNYVEYVPNTAYRLMKRITPGPFTFILKASKTLSKYNYSHTKNKSIGVRICDHIFIRTLLEIHGTALVSTSVFRDDEYIIDPKDLEDHFGKRCDGIVDDGIKTLEFSTIVDFTSDEMEIVREGKGFDLI